MLVKLRKYLIYSLLFGLFSSHAYSQSLTPSGRGEGAPAAQNPADSARWSLWGGTLVTSKRTRTNEQNTSVDITLYNYRIGATFSSPDIRFSVHGTFGTGHIYYRQILQDTYTESRGLGFKVSKDLGPITFNFGGDFVKDHYRLVLNYSPNIWQGEGRSAFTSAEARLNPFGPLWIKPLIGTRLMSLEQDAHSIGTALIAKEKRPSTLFFVGSRVELVLPDLQGGSFTPWAFVGFTREYRDIAPMGASVFLTDQAAGNAFTLFPANSFGAPTRFPARNTGLLGGGMDFNIRNAVVISGAYYREYNDKFSGINYLVRARIQW